MIQAPTTAEFLAINPLPSHLKHIEPSVRKLPFGLLMELVVGGACMGASDEQIADGLKAAADFASQSEYRCGACLGWTDFDHAFCILDDDIYRFGACCERCRQKISNGQATKAMGANMRAYLREGAR
jgi:hypothetical protein